MMHFIASLDLDWTAIIITALVCATSLKLADRFRFLAKVWLEGIRTERDIEAMRNGYPPMRGNDK